MLASIREISKLDDYESLVPGNCQYKIDLENNSEYKVIKEIGSDSLNKVILVRLKHELYAAKIFPYSVDYEKDLYLSKNSDPLHEINFSLQAKNPYIIKTKELVIGESFMFLIMEKADSDLASFLDNNILPFHGKLKFIFEIGVALDYIQSGGFTHCDIKPQNVFVKDQNILLGDFGSLVLAEDPKCDQTKLYSSPEAMGYSEGMNIYKKIFGKISTSKILSESWSFGIVCLDIIYNTKNIISSENIKRSEYAPKNKFSGPHEDLIDILSKLHDREKYPEIKGQTTATIIENIIGEVSEEDRPLFNLVCEKLLLLIPSERLTIGDFIRSPIFVSNNLKLKEDLNRFVFPKVEKMYIPSDDVEIKDLKKVFNTLFEISNYFNFYYVVIMNTIDYILQRCHISGFVKDLELFGVCVLWIMSRMFDYEEKEATLSFMCKGQNYDTEQMYILIMEIIKYEKGFFDYESIYFQLPSEQLLLKALKIMLDPEEYVKYRSPTYLSSSLLESETNEEIKNRIPKRIRKLTIEI